MLVISTCGMSVILIGKKLTDCRITKKKVIWQNCDKKGIASAPGIELVEIPMNKTELAKLQNHQQKNP